MLEKPVILTLGIELLSYLVQDVDNFDKIVALV